MDIAGKPMLQRVLERVSLIKGIDLVILATTWLPEDKALQDLARSMSIACYRGDPVNVLDRYMNAAVLYSLDHVMRVTGDCPLIDPQVCKETLDLYKIGKWDYVSNRVSYPDGLDCECFSVGALQRSWTEASTKESLEHVTPYMYKRPSPFQLQQLWADKDYSSLKWSVDTQADIDFVRSVYTQLGEWFSWREVLTLPNGELLTYPI